MSAEWETPQYLFDWLDQRYSFTLDPCATPENAKVENFYTKENDGLKQSWEGHRVFMNPPYSRGVLDKWVEKAFFESRKRNTIVVCLLPCRTDMTWFHDYVLKSQLIYFLKGRVRFVGAKGSPYFRNMIVVFTGREIAPPQLLSLDLREMRK